MPHPTDTMSADTSGTSESGMTDTEWPPGYGDDDDRKLSTRRRS